MTPSNVTSLGQRMTFAVVDDAGLRQSHKLIMSSTAKVVARFIELKYLSPVSERAKSILESANDCETFRREAGQLTSSLEVTAMRIRSVHVGVEGAEQEAEVAEFVAKELSKLAGIVDLQIAQHQRNLEKISEPMVGVDKPDGENRAQLAGLDNQIAALQESLSTAQSELKTIGAAMEIMARLSLQELSKDVQDTIETSIKLAGGLTGTAAVDPQGTLVQVKALLAKTLAVTEGNLKYLHLSAAHDKYQEQLALQRTEQRELQARRTFINNQSEYLEHARELEKHRAAYHQAFGPFIQALRQFSDVISAPHPNPGEVLRQFIQYLTPLTKA